MVIKFTLLLNTVIPFCFKVMLTERVVRNRETKIHPLHSYGNHKITAKVPNKKFIHSDWTDKPGG